MAEARGFTGVRYNLDRVEDLSLVVCPPYDIISPADQVRLLERSPLNAVRLEQGIALPSDTAEDNKYTRAAAQYRAWLDQGVLVKEARPALYVYDQEFTCGGQQYRRRSLLAAVRLEEWEKGAVLPHEEIAPKPKSDRVRLLEACRASFSPLLALYEDCDGVVGDVIGRATEVAPDATFRDEGNEDHYLWVIEDESILGTVREALMGRPIYMADGHHRYEAALAYRDKRRAQQPGYTGEEPHSFVMMALEAVDDLGLVVLPTHRLVVGPPRLGHSELLSRIAERFEISRLPLPGSTYVGHVQDALGMPTEGAPNVFGLYTGEDDALYRLVLRDVDAARAEMPTDKSTAWKELDVSVLHTFIINGTLGAISERGNGNVELVFTRDEACAVESVRSGESWLAFFLRPTLVKQIVNVALAGDRMPQKSTYFYPKQPAGLVMYDLG